MLDLTSTDINTVTEEEFYSLLVVFGESIRLKRNVIYSYQITIPETPTIEDPSPEPVTKTIYFYINKPAIEINISDFELAVSSVSVSDYGFTGERLNLITKPFRVLTGISDEIIEFDDFEEIFDKNKYDYLRSVSVEDLSFAKDIFHEVGIENNWPVVTSDTSTVIKEIISSYEDSFNDATSESELEIILNSIKLDITRLFNLFVVPDEMV